MTATPTPGDLSARPSAWLITWSDGRQEASLDPCHSDDGTCIPLAPIAALSALPAGGGEAERLLREYRAAPKFSHDHAAIKRTVALEDEIDAFLAATPPPDAAVGAQGEVKAYPLWQAIHAASQKAGHPCNVGLAQVIDALDSLSATPAAGKGVDELAEAVRGLRFDVYELTTPELRAAFDGKKTIAVVDPGTVSALKAALTRQPVAGGGIAPGEIRLRRHDHGKWTVRIGKASIPEMFDSQFDAMQAALEVIGAEIACSTGPAQGDGEVAS